MYRRLSGYLQLQWLMRLDSFIQLEPSALLLHVVTVTVLSCVLQPNRWSSWSKRGTCTWWPAAASTCAVWPPRTSTTSLSPSTRPSPRSSKGCCFYPPTSCLLYATGSTATRVPSHPHPTPRLSWPLIGWTAAGILKLNQWSDLFFSVLTWRYKPLGGAMILIQHLNAHSQVSLPAELHMFMCRSWFSSLHVQVVFDFVRFKSFLLTNVHSDFCLPCNNLYHLEKDLTWRVCTIEQNAVNVNRCNHCWRSHYDLLKPLNSRQSSQVQYLINPVICIGLYKKRQTAHTHCWRALFWF